MLENKEKSINQEIKESDTINIREEIQKYLVHWIWFVLALIIAYIGATLYLRYQTPTYSASASILIKDNNKSGISTELAAFGDLGIIGSASANNPANEIQILKSRKIIGHVVDTLQLDLTYFSQGTVKTSERYTNLPFILQFIDNKYARDRDTAFIVSIEGKNGFQFLNMDMEPIFKAEFNQPIQSGVGTLG
jgi:uncharacterized protein involved in exopolysaccharide biosynthesis